MAKIISLLVLSLCIASLFAHPAQIVSGEVKERFTLTPFQQKQLQKFREVVSDLLEDDYERSDEYLLGYLQSKHWKIFSATQMLKIAKNWKITHNIAELAKANFSYEMLERFPIRLEGFDKEGCPLTEIPFGEWDLAGYILSQEFVRDGIVNVVKHFRQVLAKMEFRNRNSFPKCHQTRLIASIQSYNSSHVSEVNSVNTCVKMMNDYVNYFPNAIFEADVIHVVDSFMPILELAKTSVSSDVYGIVKIFKGRLEDFKKNLDAVVDVNQRSSWSGGTA